jgi:hypothetical protein
VTALLPALLRTLAFGNLEHGPWGAMWCIASPVTLIGTAASSSALQLRGAGLTGSHDTEQWQLSSDEVELEVHGEGDAAHNSAEKGFDQLCRVRGRAILAGAELTVDSLGVRSVRGPLDIHECDSIRDVSAWFEPGEGIALFASRPRKTRGHGRDTVTASVLDPDGPAAVEDPRLSTTYRADGAPARAGLELWLTGEAEQYPRRAAGEALAPPAQVLEQDFEIVAQLLRWHSRGREGAGVYLLARPR